MGLSSSVSQETFEEAVYDCIGQDQFRMDTLRWYKTKAASKGMLGNVQIIRGPVVIHILEC